MDPLDTKLNFLQAQIVARAMKKRYPDLTVAFCKGMSPSGLAYEALRTSGEETPTVDLAKEIAKIARLTE